MAKYSYHLHSNPIFYQHYHQIKSLFLQNNDSFEYILFTNLLLVAPILWLYPNKYWKDNIKSIFFGFLSLSDRKSDRRKKQKERQISLTHYQKEQRYNLVLPIVKSKLQSYIYCIKTAIEYSFLFPPIHPSIEICVA